MENIIVSNPASAGNIISGSEYNIIYNWLLNENFIIVARAMCPIGGLLLRLMIDIIPR